ncbi:hypothetical protein CHUAL_006824 [Chamberlinius hualienensis]
MSSVITLIMVVLVATANAILLNVGPREDFSKRAVDLPFNIKVSSGNCLSLDTEPDDFLVVDKLWKAVKLTANSTCLYIGLRTLPNDIPGLTGTFEYIAITAEKDEIQRDLVYVQVPQSGLYVVSSQESQTKPITASTATFVFTVLKVSYRTLLAVICPIQSYGYGSITAIFTSVRNNPEIAEFEQYARDSGVDLTNLRELDPRCLIGN